MWNMAQTPAVKTPLRRSFSEHVKDSTNKAWDVFWRSVRERRLWEIEAKEACDWLRAAGFPQYVQLFKDGRFPVDVEWAKRDHPFLDKDALDSLCRRLVTLNKCLEMRLEPRRAKRRGDDCIEEDFCAISPNWTYDRRTQQWRRLSSTEDILRLADSSTGLQDGNDRHDDVSSIHSSSSTESEGRDRHHKSHREPAAISATLTGNTTDDLETSRSSSRSSYTNKIPSLETSFSGPPSPGGSGGGSSTMSLEAESCFPDKPPRKNCTTLLRKMEKLRLRGSGGRHHLHRSSGSSSRSQARHVTGRPDLVQEEEKMERLHCPSSLQVNSRSSSSHSSPHTISSSSSSNSQSECSSTVSTPSPVTRVRSNCKRSNSGAGLTGRKNRNNQNHEEDYRNQINNNNNNSHDSLVFQIPHGHKPGTFPTSLAHKSAILSPIIDSTSVNWRTGSFHGYQRRHSGPRGTSSLASGDRNPASLTSSCDHAVPSPRPALDHRLSVYDNMPDERQLSESDGSSDAERTGEDSDVSRLLAGEDVFSALDSVLERIGKLQQLVSSWSENLSEDDCQKGSTSSSSSSSASSSSCSSSSQDSPAHGSSAASPCPSSPSHIHLEVQRPEKVSANEEEPKSTSPPPRSSRVSQHLHWSSEQSLPSLPSCPGVESQSASQFLLLQKLSLLKLTALMDKYSPSSKQGWNWTVPKPPRKTKAMEVKAQRVFGVPLLLSVQQTGEPLPPCILRAFVYLRTECLDQVGLFRKSGVKSRIQFLREMVESDPDGVSYDSQSAFDVADMVKQYFRDLPEPIFSSKLCESFLHIYQYFPKDQQLLAAQAAILLLPDENREALRTLLFFLRDVVAFVDENQMTPTNIAVCLAPSLFHLNTLKKRDGSATRSSHRKYSLGRPDQRDLSENLAATQGLAHMITEAQRLFQLPEFWPGQSLSFPTEDYLSEESAGRGGGGGGGGGGQVPHSKRGEEEEEEEQDERRIQLQLNTQQLLKEAREKSRGWESHAAPEHVELYFKKMDDCLPLWMWRGSVEVEAPQEELLRRLLSEQRLWEGNLRQAAVVQTLSEDADVYRYLLQSQGHGLGSQPLQEHLLLRTWQTDPSSGPLYLSSVSTEHPEVQAEGIRVHVHSCLYLLEPTGARKTRLTHLCRTDTRGRSQEWHSKVSGHLLASGLLAIRDSFRAEYKETKI